MGRGLRKECIFGDFCVLYIPHIFQHILRKNSSCNIRKNCTIKWHPYFKNAILVIVCESLSSVHVQVSLDDVAALDDVDQCIIYYNHAIILYYLKQYKAAFTILDKVVQLIEPMGIF